MDSIAKKVTIASMVDGLPRLRVFDEELRRFEIGHPVIDTIPVVDRNTYLGIEVEVENVDSYISNNPYWRMIEDGSLRNNGREFITPPIRAWRVESALNQLFGALNQDVDFSERTSIHIHMNVRTLTIEQLETLLATYLVFEKLIFRFLGGNRYENIFCVPLVETTLGEELLKITEQKNPFVSWEKYTALNLCPITQKGTIEFRHLSGTKNIKRIMTWINIILSLKKYALQNPPETIWNKILSLNTSSLYRLFCEEVFKGQVDNLWTIESNQEMAECISYIKECGIKNEFKATLKPQVVNQNIPATVSFLDLFDDPSRIPAPEESPRNHLLRETTAASRSFQPEDLNRESIQETITTTTRELRINSPLNRI